MAEYKDNLLGETNNFLEVLEQASYLASLDKPVLIIGECGTGKELIVSRLYYLSSRWQGSFISLSRTALNKNLSGSELLGHEAGALISAQKRHPGGLERVDGGTLFLGEFATAPTMVQGKLLRVIEYGELERVSGSQSLQVNVQLVRVTSVDLPVMANEGTFRADLLDRLAFDVVQPSPLRECESDTMLMAKHFAIQICREIKLPLFPGFTEYARETLLNYRWPGDICELENVVECSVYRHGTSDYPPDDIIIDPSKQRPPEEATAVSENTLLPTSPLDLCELQMQQGKESLQLNLQQGKYNRKHAAELLGLTYHQFRALLKKHQI